MSTINQKEIINDTIEDNNIIEDMWNDVKNIYPVSPVSNMGYSY